MIERRKNKGKVTLKRLLSVVLALTMVLVMLPMNGIKINANMTDEPESGPHGSGSYQLNSVAEDYRFYTEYYVGAASGKKYTTADIERRTTVYVYAKKGEMILFGSSVSDSEINEHNEWTKSVTGKDIVITTPSGAKVCEDVLLPNSTDKNGKFRPKGYGYIANPTQEKYGPMVNHADEIDKDGKYYVPLTYEVKESGVYTFEFHSRTGYNDGTSPKAVKAGSTGWDQKGATVAAWDVTVIGNKKDNPSAWEVKEGRAWADYLALTTGAGGSTKSDLKVHILTHDGYVYKVDFKEAVPFGFIFFANNTGFMTKVRDGNGGETKVPIYHSFYDSTNDLDLMSSEEKIFLHKPNEKDTSTEETYKIFFNQPSKDLQGVRDKKNTIIKTKPDENVTLTNLKFQGIADNIARSGHGGAFSFHASGEAMVSITLDLRKAIFESEQTMDTYNGSGIVELTAPAHEGDNTFYWDGKDTDGIVVPSGIYGNQNVVIATEIKRGELHFPVIDLEGLYGGLCVERLNKSDKETEENRQKSAFNLYYNNNPLAYGTIEGRDFLKITEGNYNILSDGTRSYNIESKRGGMSFFKDYPSSISTLKKDDKEYLSKKLFSSEYGSLSETQKSIIDAEFGKDVDTYHFEPIDSRHNETMKFSCADFNGGGNQAGIDAWTYYSQGVDASMISFAVLDTKDKGVIRGQVFYDGNKNSNFDSGSTDYPLANMKVRLIDSTGKALVHKESLPCFDASGHFVYNRDGSVKYELKDVIFDTITDASGNYRFTGVPYDPSSNTEYYVQVMLADTQTEVMRYTCTTSEEIKNKLRDITNPSIPFHNNVIDSAQYGADGNKIVEVNNGSKIYGYKYARGGENNETIFSGVLNAQKIVFDNNNIHLENGIRVESFKKIGYCTAVPSEHQKDYKVTKIWGSGTHKISDGLTVELWVWNDSAVREENTLSLSRRTGALIDTQVLNEGNNWTYTWKNLDDRLQYYVLEYYTKKKDNGEIIYNDKFEPRLVLIGGTMPIFGTVPDGNQGIYGFDTNLGDYPEKIVDPNDSTKMRIPIQKFEDKTLEMATSHDNSITKQEKLASIENNARQYNVTYKLIKEDSGKTNAIYITNKQVYDDRSYYVWLNHQTVLPDLIAQTYVSHAGSQAHKESHSVKLEKDRLLDSQTGEYTIKGLSVSSVDAASTENAEGNATKAFRIKDEGKDALFTATNKGNYKSGTGTRTYQVKYVVNKANDPVQVKVGDSGKLVLASDGLTEVENNTNYTVYSWYMTIHVYDVTPDDVVTYAPTDGTVNLQSALPKGTNLSWELTHDAANEYAVNYKSNDTRENGILHNDTYRLPLYKTAINPDMGSCADLVGIAYAGDSTVEDVSELYFYDTFDSLYGKSVKKNSAVDGTAEVEGIGGTVKATLNTTRNTRINRTQDHANFVDVTFSPKKHVISTSMEPAKDVFYYKIVVFAEDSTYMFYDYDEIDATEGVVMYTYFVMQSTAMPDQIVAEGEDPITGSNPSGTDDVSSNQDPSNQDSSENGDTTQSKDEDEKVDDNSSKEDEEQMEDSQDEEDNLDVEDNLDDENNPEDEADSEDEDSNDKVSVPKTGEYFHLNIWVGLMIVGSIILIRIVSRRKRIFYIRR